MNQAFLENIVYESARECGATVTRRHAHELVVDLFNAIVGALDEGDRVRLPKIGSLVKRAPRKMAAKALPHIKKSAKPRPTIKFIVSQSLRDTLTAI